MGVEGERERERKARAAREERKRVVRVGEKKKGVEVGFFFSPLFSRFLFPGSHRLHFFRFFFHFRCGFSTLGNDINAQRKSKPP